MRGDPALHARRRDQEQWRVVTRSRTLGGQIPDFPNYDAGRGDPGRGRADHARRALLEAALSTAQRGGRAATSRSPRSARARAAAAATRWTSRTSMMTHGWAPLEWQDAARETLAGLAELPFAHDPALPAGGWPRRARRRRFAQCYSLRARAARVLRSDRAAAAGSLANSPAAWCSLVLPTCGLPAGAAAGREPRLRASGVVDRLVLDSREWRTFPRRTELVPYFRRVAISDRLGQNHCAGARSPTVARHSPADRLRPRAAAGDDAAPRVAGVAPRPGIALAEPANTSAARDRQQRSWREGCKRPALARARPLLAGRGLRASLRLDAKVSRAATMRSDRQDMACAFCGSRQLIPRTTTCRA